VDPTAAVAPGRIYDTLADRAPGADGLLGAWVPTPVFDTSDWLRHGWNDFVLGFDAARQRRMLQPLGITTLESGRLIALFALTASLALLWMAWWTARAEREPDPVLRAWHRLDARYRRIGLGRHPHEPAAVWAERVSFEADDGTLSLRELSCRFNTWRYAGGQPGVQAKALIKALDRHHAGRPSRWTEPRSAPP
jgi:hypothetical protein